MAQLYVEKLAAQVVERIIHGETKPRVRPVVLSGKAAGEIVDYAEKSEANLVVLTSHGRSGSKSWALGSTAAKIIERITKPVLLVRADSTGKQGSILDKIIVPLDGSEKGEAVLPFVKELTGKIKSEVMLLRVIATGYHIHTIGGLDYISLPETQIGEMKTEAGPYLARISSVFKGTKAAIQTEIRTGDAAEEILNSAEERNVRLIALSGHGHSGIERWTFGSVAHKVVHSGKTSLLLVRAG